MSHIIKLERYGIRDTTVRLLQVSSVILSGLRRGEILVVFESKQDNAIFSQMLLKTMPAVKEFIALLASEDKQCIHRIKFEIASGTADSRDLVEVQNINLDSKSIIIMVKVTQVKVNGQSVSQ